MKWKAWQKRSLWFFTFWTCLHFYVTPPTPDAHLAVQIMFILFCYGGWAVPIIMMKDD